MHSGYDRVFLEHTVSISVQVQRSEGLKMSQPQTVSVCLPVYNGERFLAQAIESVLKQSYADFELLIIDDCSTDSSAEIIQHYVSVA